MSAQIRAGSLHSDFIDDQAAVQVEETSGPDYSEVGDIPCVPPWFFGVIADGDWFAPHVGPAPDIDLASFIGAAIPTHIPFEGTAFNLSGVPNLIDLEQGNFGQDDTVPWAIYSCAKIPVPFPLAVGVNNTPARANYPTPKVSVRRANGAAALSDLQQPVEKVPIALERHTQ